MAPRRFFDPSLPPTLQLALWLSYVNGFYGVLDVLRGGLGVLGIVGIAGAVGAYGLANERRIGYYVALGAGVVNLVVSVLAFAAFGAAFLLQVAFAGALVAGALHPRSRRHVAIYLD